MQCPNGHEVGEGRAFCDECGAPIAPPDSESRETALMTYPRRQCPYCGNRAILPEHRYCDLCHTALPKLEDAGPLLAEEAPAIAAATVLSVQPGGAFQQLDTGLEYTVGRSDPATNWAPLIDLEPLDGRDKGVSRRHCVLRYVEGAWTIEDLGSVNGTVLRGVGPLQPHKAYALPRDAVLQLGGITLVLKSV